MFKRGIFREEELAFGNTEPAFALTQYCSQFQWVSLVETRYEVVWCVGT
jgi:hypothetical protein